MSAGLQTINALIGTGSRAVARTLDDRFFTEDEQPAWRFFTSFVDRHGEFPSVQVMAENGFQLPHASGPVQYHRDQLENRLAYNIWMSQSEPFYEQVMAGRMREAREILEDVMHRWRTGDAVRDTFTLADAMQLVVDDYYTARANRGRLQGATYGYDILDEKTGGCRPGDVATIVARPGLGKTMSLLRMAAKNWERGEPVAVISMEMHAVEIARRVLAMGSGTSAEFIQKGTLSEWGEEQMLATAERIGNMPPFHLLIGNMSKSVRDVDMMIQEHGPSAVYVDAGYLLNPSTVKPGAKRFELAADTIRELKDLALRRDKPIIQTVQFNRQQKADEDMTLDNIGQTDEIGQISSLVLGMKKGSAPNEQVSRKYSVLKNRHGEDFWSFETNFFHAPFNMELIEEEISDGIGEDGEYDGTQGAQPAQGEWTL